MEAPIAHYLTRSGEIAVECRGIDAEIARLEARKAALLGERTRLLLAEVAPGAPGFDAAERSMIAELSTALHIGRGTAARTLALGWALDDRFPATRDALAAGRISLRHAAVVIEAAAPLGVQLSPAHTAYEAQVLPFAEAETAARTGAFARTVAATVAPETIVERHRRARGDRRVRLTDLDDGMSLLSAVLPAVLAHAVYDRLTRIGRGIRALSGRTDDDRSGFGIAPDPRDGSTPGSAPGSISDTGTRSRSGSERHCRVGSDSGAGAASDIGLVSGVDADSALGRQTASSTGDAVRRAFDRIVTGFDDPGPSRTAHADGGPAEGPPSREAYVRMPRAAVMPAPQRSLDEIRADALADLLLAAGTDSLAENGLAAIRGMVQVTIAATTVCGLDDRPAELDGHGALAPEIVRALAGDAVRWERLFLDPVGMITHTDAYAPTDRMRRRLRARDQHCRFPGCRMPAIDAEIDHTRDHAKGGATAVANLASLCRGHHALKHPDLDDRWRWSAVQRADGTIVWSDPGGREYVDAPVPRVMFA